MNFQLQINIVYNHRYNLFLSPLSAILNLITYNTLNWVIILLDFVSEGEISVLIRKLYKILGNHDSIE